MSVNMCKLGLGCWSFGGDGVRNPDDSNSISIINKALENGMNHLDTAHDYGNGHSEEVIGNAISGKRDQYYIATKTHQVDNQKELISLVQKSLERLRTDWIDLFYVHWPHSGMDLRPMMEGLETCRSRGLIREIGVSNFDIGNLEQAVKEARIDVHQLGYNLLWRFSEKEVIPWCRNMKIRTVAYSPLAQGLLSDKGTDLSRRSPDDPRNKTIYYRDEIWIWLKPIVEKMQDIAMKAETSLSDLALRCVLKTPLINAVITGAGTVEQLAAHRNSLLKVDDNLQSLFELQALSEEAMLLMPDEGNIFQYHP